MTGVQTCALPILAAKREQIRTGHENVDRLEEQLAGVQRADEALQELEAGDTALEACLEKIAEMMRIIYKANNLPEEYVWVAALSSKSKLIGMFEVSHGTATSSLINPKEIFSRLCLCGAVSFIIIHNHPSGDSKPSEDDMKVTKRLKECANLMGIKMLDHIIIGDTYYSIYENGYAF